jgi:hypothetical protein
MERLKETNINKNENFDAKLENIHYKSVFSLFNLTKIFKKGIAMTL